MDIIGIVGLILAFGLMLFGMVFSKDAGLNMSLLGNFMDPQSMAITIGGTIAALMIAYPLDIFKRIPKHLGVIFKPKKYDPMDYISQLVDFAKEARMKGLLSLEDKVKDTEDVFMKKSLMLVADSIDAEKVKEILATELDFLEERHAMDSGFYDKAAALAPGFGMIGTLIGLVNMLANLDPEKIGSSMSVALLTTFYGSLIANVFFSPMANKLRMRHEEEMLCKMIICEGVQSIQAGENPRFIEEKLLLLLPTSKREVSGEEAK